LRTHLDAGTGGAGGSDGGTRSRMELQHKRPTPDIVRSAQ